MKAMNCPGHMLLFGSRHAELQGAAASASPSRRRSTATSSRRTLHGLLRVRQVTQDDAHIFCSEDQIQDEIAGVVDYARYLYELFGMTASAELSTRPDNKLGTDEQWDRNEAALEEALKLQRHPVHDRPGRGRVLRPEDRPAHGATRSAVAGRWARSSSTPRCRRASGSRTSAPTTPSIRSYVVHRALYGSFERFIGILVEHYAGAFPFWLAPVQIRILPVGEAHREPAEALREEARRVPRRDRRLRRDRRQEDPQRGGGEDPVRDRLRRQGVRRVARDPRARRQAAHARAF